MEPKTKKWKKVKTDMLRSISKQSVESVLKKKRKATVGRDGASNTIEENFSVLCLIPVHYFPPAKVCSQ